MEVFGSLGALVGNDWWDDKKDKPIISGPGREGTESGIPCDLIP